MLPKLQPVDRRRYVVMMFTNAAGRQDSWQGQMCAKASAVSGAREFAAQARRYAGGATTGRDSSAEGNGKFQG